MNPRVAPKFLLVTRMCDEGKKNPARGGPDAAVEGMLLRGFGPSLLLLFGADLVLRAALGAGLVLDLVAVADLVLSLILILLLVLGAGLGLAAGGRGSGERGAAGAVGAGAVSQAIALADLVAAHLSSAGRRAHLRLLPASPCAASGAPALRPQRARPDHREEREHQDDTTFHTLPPECGSDGLDRGDQPAENIAFFPHPGEPAQEIEVAGRHTSV